MMTRARRLAAPLLVLGLALSACGAEAGDPGTAEDPSATPSQTSPSSPTETPTEATEPLCADVWVADQILPQNYQGCQDDEKQKWVEAFTYRCSSGQKLVTYRRTFYAAKGEAINETTTPLARDPKFKRAMAACGA